MIAGEVREGLDHFSLEDRGHRRSMDEERKERKVQVLRDTVEGEME